MSAAPPNVRSMIRRAVVRAGADPLLLRVADEDELVDQLTISERASVRWGPSPYERHADGPWDRVEQFFVTYSTTLNPQQDGARPVIDTVYVNGPHAVADDLAYFVRHALLGVAPSL